MTQYFDRSASVVVVGQFAPARFHPAWFVHHGLLTENYLVESTIGAIANNVAQWSHPLLGDVLVLPDRLAITCKTEALWMVVRDVVEGVIALDPGNPVKMVGFNFAARAVVDGEDADLRVWHALGDLFAPKGVWREALDLPSSDSWPGLEGIKLSYPLDADEMPGSRRIIAFEPILAEPFSLSVLVNDHFELAAAAATQSDRVAAGEREQRVTEVDLLRELLAERYEQSISTGRVGVEHLFSVALKRARAIVAETDARSRVV